MFFNIREKESEIKFSHEGNVIYSLIFNDKNDSFFLKKFRKIIIPRILE